MATNRSKRSEKTSHGPESAGGNSASAKEQARKLFGGRKAGRNSKTAYLPEFAHRAKLFCQKGATTHQLAILFGVPPNIILQWQAFHDEFAAACKVPLEVYTNRIVDSVAERAIGYDETVDDVRLADGRIVKTRVRKHFPADVSAATFWNKLRPVAGSSKIDPNDPHVALQRLYDWAMHPDRR